MLVIKFQRLYYLIFILVTVTYEAGPGGYTENRVVQDGFVEIRARPVKIAEPAPAPAPVTQRPTPRPRPVTTPAPPPPPPQNTDSDLVARIIAQLTPFIRQTVTSSLNSQTSAPAAPAPTPIRQPVAVPAAAPAASSLTGVFGETGANNVRVNTPDFDFAYELRK